MVSGGLTTNGLSSIAVCDSFSRYKWLSVAEKWNEGKEMWLHYSVAAKANKEAGEVQVATFLAAIGPEVRKVF